MKVAISGAGINGLYLALKLSKIGNKVTVFEKNGKIGKETCSGLFSEKILDFIPEAKNLVQNKIDFVLIRFPRKTLKVKFSEIFFVMDHAKLDSLVAGLAKEAGVEIILNHPVNLIPEGFDRVLGCDGPFSQIRKSFGQKDSKMRIAIQGILSKKDSSNFVETWPTKKGFLWKIPRGENIEYGIIDDPITCQKNFNDFLDKNDLKLENIKSAVVPADFFMPKSKKVALCGDAAGLTKPWSGGGVIWGLLAADLLLKNFPDFLEYQKAVETLFLPKIIFSRIITRLVYFFGFNIPWILPRSFRIDGDFLKIFKKNTF